MSYGAVLVALVERAIGLSLLRRRAVSKMAGRRAGALESGSGGDRESAATRGACADEPLPHTRVYTHIDGEERVAEREGERG